YFISVALQDYFLFAQRALFVISTSFLALVFFCLLRETPPHQASIKNYLILIQVTLCAKDIYMDILFEPIPIMPIPGAYCNGLLCHGAIPMQYQFTILIWFDAMIGISIILCSLFRHQQLLPLLHWMKM
ncbi:hypothetical protein PFISCL1PPCAC_1347, partial [Pristionchus fissidentatus]